MNDIKSALDKCTAMMNTLPQKYFSKIWLLHGLLNEAMEHKDESETDFENAVQCDDDSKRFLQENKTVTLDIFPTMNRLCTNFPQVEISFKSHPPIVLP